MVEWRQSITNETISSTLENSWFSNDVLWCLHQDQLVDIRDIAASDLAFAAVRADGRVVTWGHGRAGSDSLAVQAEIEEPCRAIEEPAWNMLEWWLNKSPGMVLVS